MERDILANKIKQHITNGCLSISFYPVKVKKGGDEQKNQANQFAIDHESLFLYGDKLSVGMANAISKIPLWDIMETIIENAKDLLNECGLLADSDEVKFDQVAIFTHGEVDQMQIATLDGTYNSWIKNSYLDFVSKTVNNISSNSRILLYACNVAGEEGTVNPLAEKMTVAYQNGLNLIYGTDNATVEVWGHKDSGHTSANHRLVQFYFENEQLVRLSFLDEIARSMCEEIFTEKSLDFESYDNVKKKKQCLQLCYSTAYDSLQAYGPPSGYSKGIKSKKVDENNMAYTNQLGPINNLIREIPFVGIYNYWIGLTGSNEPNYGYLNLSEDGINRVNSGMAKKRTKFKAAFDALKNNHIFTTID